MGDITEIVSTLRNHTDDGCFACGMRNPIGLQINEFAIDGSDVTAVFNARRDLQGTNGSLHGGIAATAIDEILAWSAILLEGVLSVTGTLELRYRRPLADGGTYLLRGRVDERSGRRLRLSGGIEHDGRPAVTGSGLYLVTDDVSDLVAAANA